MKQFMKANLQIVIACFISACLASMYAYAQQIVQPTEQIAALQGMLTSCKDSLDGSYNTSAKLSVQIVKLQEQIRQLQTQLAEKQKDSSK